MRPAPGIPAGSSPLDIGRLEPRFHTMRAMTAALVLAASLGLVVSLDWTSGLYVAVGALLGGLDALRRRKSPGRLVHAMVLDITLVAMGLAVGGLPTEVALIPVVSVVVAAALFIGDRRVLWLSVYAIVGVTIALTWSRFLNPVEWDPVPKMIVVALSIVCFLPMVWWMLKETTKALGERRVLEQTLSEKEARYRLIAEGVSDAVVTTDESGVIMYANPAVKSIFGYEPSEIVGKHIVILTPDRVRESLRRGTRGYIEMIRRSLEEGRLELTGRHRDGRELTLELSFGQSDGFEGRRFVGTIRDITDRKDAERALRESEARYRGLFEGVPVGVYRTTIGGEILDVNQTLAEMLGYDSADKVIGQFAQDFYPDPGDREAWLHKIEIDEAARVHEIQLWPSGGSPIWVRDTGRETRDPSGGQIIYEGTLEDVNERRLAEERLQGMVESQRQRLLYEQALSACSHTLLVGTDDDILEKALGALLEATGVGAVFIGRNDQDPEVGLVSNLICEVNAEGHPADLETWTRVPWSKTPLAYAHLSRNDPFVFYVTDLEDDEKAVYEDTDIKSGLDIPIFVDNEWLGLVTFVDFETERTWQDQEISSLRTAAQMIGAFWERQQAHRKLQELVRYKDEFVASVSHELRTPLTAVVGISEELADHDISEFSADELREFHQLIAQQSREVACIVEDLLVAARVDNDAVTVDLQPVDLDAEVSATITGWPSEFGGVVHDAGGGKVEADPGRVRQIVRNLLTNTIRYGGDRVAVVTHVDGERGVVQVRDNGSGVAAEDLERIFEPYERASGTGAVNPGSVGLGLYVSLHLAGLMGGDLTCRREDAWTVFELSLPLL